MKHEARLNNIKEFSPYRKENTAHVTVTKINWLTLFKEIIAVCCRNRTKLINILCVQGGVTER
jgi:hypothetical protein